MYNSYLCQAGGVIKANAASRKKSRLSKFLKSK
ncbi:MAG: 30S ribosomal protein S20 [Chloroflexi bacterium]|nr:30S ribosomal protein S20 [Chloroflexota bacterium]